MLNKSPLKTQSAARWRGFIAALAAVLAAGSLAWAGSAVASGSGGGDVWFTAAQNAGGTLGDYGSSVAVASDGTVFVTGVFRGTASFPSSPSTNIQLSASGEWDIFVAALNADDSYFEWAVKAGGSSWDEPYSIALTADDTPMITGYFTGVATFPTGRPAPDDSITLSATATCSGCYETFVAAMNTDDSYFAWATSVSGATTDGLSSGYAVAVTADDTPIIAGSFANTVYFPTGKPAPDDSITLTASGDEEMFIAAMNSDDSYFSWAIGTSGDAEAYGQAVAVTSAGSPVIAGKIKGTVHFPTGLPAPDDSITLVSQGTQDVFVASLNADDSYFAWAIPIGTTSNSLYYGSGIAVSSDDTVIVTGDFTGIASFPTGKPAPDDSITLVSTDSDPDIFVAALNADDSYFAWAVNAVGAGDDYSYSVSVTGGGSPVITGSFRSALSFPTGRAAPDDSIVLIPTGGYDVFVAGMEPGTSNFLWAVRAGASSSDQGKSVALTSEDTPVITGDIGTGTSLFPSSSTDAISLTSAGSSDVLVAWLGPYVAPPTPAISSVSPATGSVAGGTSVTITGTDLTGATAVTFGGVAATTITSNTATQIVATSPAGAAGSVDVAVTTAGGTATAANAFTYTSDPDPDPGPQPVPPSAPISVMAAAGDASAVVSWGIPESPGSFPISTYQVVVSPGGATCLAEAPKTVCSVSGLTNGESYTAQVRALSGAGWGAYSAASPEFTPRADDVSIVITGTRGDVRGRPGVVVNGTTSGFGEGAILRPWVKLPGQTRYAEGAARILVADDGSFTWQRRTGKKVYVVVKTPDGSVKSNRVIIPAP